MALAKKCDRCGQYYNHYPLGNEPGIYNAIRQARVDSVGTIVREGSHLDLCPKCMDDLFHFLHNAETENTNA